MDPPIPAGFQVGDADGGGDCFYHAVAQGLNQIQPQSEFTVKSLRMLCKKYGMEKPSSWLRGALENQLENQNMDYYASHIEYCADDFANPRSKVMPFKLENPIWGRPEIEGRIICDQLNVRLHVIEKYDVNSKPALQNTKTVAADNKDENTKPKIEVWCDQVVDESGSKSVASVDYNGCDTIHIINEGDHHFKPILRIGVPDEESDASSLSSSDDAKIELGVELINHVNSSVPETEIVAEIIDILERGGDVNFKDANRDCNTAMHFAVKLNLPKVFKCLCERGGDASLKNRRNKTPLEMTRTSQRNIYTEILNSVSRNDANTRKLSQDDIDAIIRKQFTGPRSHLDEIKDTIESQGHSLTEIESTYVNDQYLALCLKYWLGDIRAKMLKECSQYTTSDIDAIQTLDQVPAPFRESNFYKRLILHKDLLDEDRKKPYMDSFRSQILELVNSRKRKTFGIEEIDKILDKLVHEKKDLKQVMSHLNNLANNEMNDSDQMQIEQRYITYCCQYFIQDLRNISDLSTDQSCKIVSVLPQIANLVEIGDEKLSPLNKMLSFELVMKHLQLITEKGKRILIKEFKHASYYCIKSSNHSTFREITFLKSQSKYLDSVKDTKSASKTLRLTEFCNGQLSFQQLHGKIINLHDDNNENLPALKEAAMEMGDKQMALEKNLLESVSKYLEEPKTETKTLDARLVIETTGYNITISQVIAKVEQQLRNNGKVEEVRFVAASTVHNDVSIKDTSIWNGKNIVVMSRILQIHGCVTWDVSGKDYKSNAKDGTQDGEHGHKGADGKAGESGGNVLISVMEIKNSQNFTIISSGGSGGKGQDGGKGKDGADGHGITRDAFHNKFPPPSKYVAALRGDLVLKNIASMQEEMADLEFGWYQKLYGKSESYDKTNQYQSFVNRTKELCGKGTIVKLEGTTRQKNKITFAYHCGNIKINCQSFLLYKGAPGKAGSPGGEGGHGGDGGYGGEITVFAPDSSITIVANCGRTGENGKGGLHGKCGKSGWDMGYIDYSVPLPGWFTKRNTWPEYFGEAQNKKLQLTYYSDNRYTHVICPYRHSKRLAQKHVRITEIPEQETSLKTYEERTQNKETKEKQVQAVAARKKTISYDTVHNSYSHIIQNEFDLNLTQLDELEEMANEQLDEIKTEAVEERTEHTFHRRITYKPPFSNPEKGESNPSILSPQSTVLPFLQVCGIIKKSSLSNGNWKRNWLEIKNMELGIADLKILFKMFENQTASVNLNSRNGSANPKSKHHALRVKRILAAKFQIATLADNANKLLNIITLSDVPDSKKAASYLHEYEGACEISYKDWGTLSKYICRDHQTNRQKVQDTCRKLLADFAADLQKVVSQQRTVEEVVQCPNHTVIQKTLRFYIQLEHKGNCAIYNMVECCRNKNITDKLLEDIKNGRNSPSYRELLAMRYNVNIRMYEKDASTFKLISDHNPIAKMKAYFCLGDAYCTQLDVNERHWKLRNEQNWHGAVYKNIVHDIEKRRREDYEDYFQNKRFSNGNDVTSKCVPEYFPAADFGKTARRISLYFPGEDKAIERLFERFDTPSCDNPHIIEIMGQILKRFTYEGNHISALEMLVLVNAILTSITEEEYGLDIVFWIVSAHRQHNWIVELLLLDLENCYKQQLENKADWHENLSRVKDRHILLLFKKKLAEQMHIDKIPFDLMKNLTLHLHYADDINYLSNS